MRRRSRATTRYLSMLATTALACTLAACGFGLDASDEDGGTNTNSGTPAMKIGPQPVTGMYLPDAIAGYTVDGKH